MHADGTVTFRVWAPHAERVELVLGERRLAMSAGEHGWRSLTAEAVHGDDYAFVLDGGDERPDPASRWQPDGVHGRSRVLDERTFPWTDAGWRPPPLPVAVMYELHVGTFTPEGTFAAAAERLSALAEVGVTHVEVMPVNAFNGTAGWGYDGVDWYAVHAPYGGGADAPAAFAAFVDAAHRAGLAVVLDVVYNHLGPSGNYLADFGPYLTDAYATPWGDALNLDGPGSDAVRAFIVDNARQWLADFHVDGLRLDAVHGLVDRSATHVLAELSTAVAALSVQLGRELVLIAESDRADPLTVLPRALGGLGLDGQWADDLHHAVHTALTGEDDGYYVDYAGLPDVAAAYRRGFVYDGRYSAYRDRTVGAPLPDAVPGWRLVACVQNHDQVGNRAAGDRLTTLVEPALARVAAVLLAAAPTTPLLFMGEEYGETAPFQYFTSHPEPELAEAVRRGRAEEFSSFGAFSTAGGPAAVGKGGVPDPQDAATVRRSTLDWARRDTTEGRQRLALWRDLLALRRAVAALANGRRDLVTVVHADEVALSLVRRDAREPAALLTVLLAADAGRVAVPATGWRLLLSSDGADYGGEGTAPQLDGASVLLPGRSAALWVAT